MVIAAVAEMCALLETLAAIVYVWTLNTTPRTAVNAAKCVLARAATGCVTMVRDAFTNAQMVHNMKCYSTKIFWRRFLGSLV